MPSAPVPPYCQVLNVTSMPALDGSGSLKSRLPTSSPPALVSCKKPGVTPGVGASVELVQGPSCPAGTVTAGFAPVRHALPDAVHA
jgi:hypothetical protein